MSAAPCEEQSLIRKCSWEKSMFLITVKGNIQKEILDQDQFWTKSWKATDL